MTSDYAGIGIASSGLSKNNEAIKYLSESLRIYEKILGTNSPVAIDIREALENTKKKAKQ